LDKRPKVVPEQDDRVETTERRIDPRERKELRVTGSAAAADPDRVGRDVDCDHLVPALLEEERHRPAPQPTSSTRPRT
jgi:hypothetical protein